MKETPTSLIWGEVSGFPGVLGNYPRSVLVFVFAAALLACSSPRYRSDITSGIDQKLEFENGMDLETLILDRLEKAERGLEVKVRVEDVNNAYRSLQKWIADIKDSEGEVEDKKRLIEKYPVLSREGAPDNVAKIKNKIADKTEGLFNTSARNRRQYLAKRFNLVLREEKHNILFVFLPRGNLGM